MNIPLRWVLNLDGEFELVPMSAITRHNQVFFATSCGGLKLVRVFKAGYIDDGDFYFPVQEFEPPTFSCPKPPAALLDAFVASYLGRHTPQEGIDTLRRGVFHNADYDVHGCVWELSRFIYWEQVVLRNDSR